jgi:Domain of unknown function (DUF1854)
MSEDNFDLVLLQGKNVTLFRTGGDAIRATINDPALGVERTYTRVQIARAFPLLMAQKWIGLRDEKDNDIGMLETLEGMDADSLKIVHAELERRYFIPKVLKVIAVKEEFGVVTWDVETDKGPKTYLIQDLRGSTQSISATRVLMTDREGNRFEFPDLTKMDGKTLQLLGRAV